MLSTGAKVQLRLHKEVWQDNTYFCKKRKNCIALSLKYDSILRKPSSNLIYIFFIAQLVLYYMILYYKIISIPICNLIKNLGPNEKYIFKNKCEHEKHQT